MGFWGFMVQDSEFGVERLRVCAYGGIEYRNSLELQSNMSGPVYYKSWTAAE